MSLARAPARRGAGTPPPRVLLVGSPNSGKSTLFNALTGLSQNVGNYPGVTVERKIGRMCLASISAAWLARGDRQCPDRRVPTGVELVDLPGTYSLTPRSPDEALATRMILGLVPGERAPDGLVIVVNAVNLRRQLYLASQVLELGVPAIVVLSMVDAARGEGLEIDAAALGANLGVPVVPAVTRRRAALVPVREAIAKLVSGARPPEVSWRWPEAVERELDALMPARPSPLPGARAMAARSLVDESDDAMGMLAALVANGGASAGSGERARGATARSEEHLPATAAPLASAVHAARRRLRTAHVRPATLEARWRFETIDALVEGVVTGESRRSAWADRLDAVLTHRLMGPIVFTLVMAAMFMSIFEWAAPLMALIDAGFAALGEATRAALSSTPLSGGVLESLIVDGAITGVGSVIVFVPQIAFLFLFLALLEGCGYMARTSLLMDRLLRSCGLSGHSFVPMLSSFACAIPGVMSARTIADSRERLVTILVAPLMSCSARIPVYTILIAAFVPATHVAGILPLQGLVFFSMYLVGIVVAVPVAYLLKRMLGGGPPSTFVMELPAYRRPSLRAVLMRVYLPVNAFIRQAGTIILAMSILIWALGTFPRSGQLRLSHEASVAGARATSTGEALTGRLAEIDAAHARASLAHSALGRVGRAIEPAVEPLGWDWRLGTAAIASFPAREVVVSTLGIIYGLGEGAEEGELIGKLRAASRPDGTAVFSLPVALSVMVFFALCCQCGATVATIRRESGSWRWPVFVFTYMSVLAYVGALIVYQLGSRLG